MLNAILTMVILVGGLFLLLAFFALFGKAH
jgi:hypothetical protein